MDASMSTMETIFLCIVTILLGTFILCGFYAMFFKFTIGTRDNLGGDQRYRRDRDSTSYEMAIGAALEQARMRRKADQQAYEYR